MMPLRDRLLNNAAAYTLTRSENDDVYLFSLTRSI
jgi:hypothetical protein